MLGDFDTFARNVTPALMRLALALNGGHKADAEDLVQSTLVRLFSKWDSLQMEHANAYAKQVLVREQSSLKRKVRWKREVLVENTPDLVDRSDPFCEVDGRHGLEVALGKLPTRQRQAVILHYLEDFTVPETARLLGCSQGTVKRSAHDGLRALRTHFPVLVDGDTHDN